MDRTANQQGSELPIYDISKELTPAALGFIAEHYRLAALDTFLGSTQLFVLEHLDQAVKYFVSSNKSTPTKKGLYKAAEMPERFSSHFFLETHKALIEDVFLCKAVENFLKYLVDLLAMVFRTKPEMLRSSEQEKLSYILSFADMDSLIDAIAEKKVEKLSYLGTQELFDYFRSQLGFELFVTPEEQREMAEAIEIRNIIVHNRGLVSKIYKSRVLSCSQEIGERVALPDTLFTRVKLVNLVLRIDQKAILKWELPVLNAH